MYDYIKGQLTHLAPDRISVEVHGIGYQIIMASTHIFKLPQIGSSVCLYLSYVVREDSQKLFGFLERSERQLFEQLSDVTGIGPKTALSLVGHLSVDNLHRAVAAGDIVTLSKIPGIGKKTAERLIIEMRDRVKKLASPDAKPLPMNEPSQSDDAIAALVHLGYTSRHAQTAVESVLKKQGEITLSKLITEALKII